MATVYGPAPRLPSARDTTTALPSTATIPCAARQFRHAFGIAPLGRDNPVSYSQPHPREARFTRSIYQSRASAASTILAILRRSAQVSSNDPVGFGAFPARCRCHRKRVCQSPCPRGTSRFFVGASALLMARSTAATAADLVGAWPMINMSATDADHFQTPRSTP
jgi:hypothetical protein